MYVWLVDFCQKNTIQLIFLACRYHWQTQLFFILFKCGTKLVILIHRNVVFWYIVFNFCCYIDKVMSNGMLEFINMFVKSVNIKFFLSIAGLFSVHINVFIISVRQIMMTLSVQFAVQEMPFVLHRVVWSNFRNCCKVWEDLSHAVRSYGLELWMDWPLAMYDCWLCRIKKKNQVPKVFIFWQSVLLSHNHS